MTDKLRCFLCYSKSKYKSEINNELNNKSNIELDDDNLVKYSIKTTQGKYKNSIMLEHMNFEHNKCVSLIFLDYDTTNKSFIENFSGTWATCRPVTNSKRKQIQNIMLSRYNKHN